MRVAVDANIVAAALVRPDGWTAGQLARADITFVAPQFIEIELREHEAEYTEKAKCSLDEWRQRVRSVLARLELVQPADLVRFSRHALVLATRRRDPDDEPYAAAFLAAGADFLWTRDEALKEAIGARAGPVLPR